MENVDVNAKDSLLEAERLGRRIQQSTRWYARYLLIFAAGSFAMALGYAALGPDEAAAVVTPIWVAFVILISVYANRQRSQFHGLNRLNGIMIAVWAVIWAVTIFGSFSFDQALWWWLVAGVALALPPLFARQVFLRRTAGR